MRAEAWFLPGIEIRSNGTRQKRPMTISNTPRGALLPVCRFLVGLPTQCFPARVRPALNLLSFLAVSSTGRGLSTDLSPDAPPPPHDHDALANGPFRSIADSQALTHSGSQEW